MEERRSSAFLMKAKPGAKGVKAAADEYNAPRRKGEQKVEQGKVHEEEKVQ